MIFRNRNYPRACTPDMVFEELEARIVLDASVDHVPGHQAPDLAQSHDDLQHAAMPAASAGSDLQPGTLPSHAPGLDLVLISDSVKNADSIAEAAIPGSTVIKYDANHENLHSLVQDLEVLVDETGSHIANLAIVDHAQEGLLHVGTDSIDAANIHEHAADLDKLRASFTEDGQIQLYGCSLAGNPAGQHLVSSLAILTSTDVYASTDNTGSPGGNWDLEYGPDSSAVQSALLDLDSVAGIETNLLDPEVNFDPDTKTVVSPEGTGYVSYTGLVQAIDDAGDQYSCDVTADPLGWTAIFIDNGGGAATITHSDALNYHIDAANLEDLNNALATLRGNLVDTLTEPGGYEITITVNELVGPPAEQGSATFHLIQNVVAENTAPYFTIGTSTFTTDEKVTLDLTGVEVDDADAGVGIMRAWVEVTQGEGTLTITNPGTSTFNFTIGDGTDDRTIGFTGTLADLKDVFQNNPVQYYNDIGFDPGPVTVTFYVNDQGNTGVPADGNPSTLWDYAQIQINLANFVNDAPEINYTGADPVDMVANDQLQFTGANTISISDRDADAAQNPIYVQLTSTNGTMTIPGRDSVTITTPGGGYQENYIQFYDTIDNINAALSGLIFQTYPETSPFFVGTASIGIDANDDGWSAPEGTQVGAEPAIHKDIQINVQAPDFWGRWPRGSCSS